MSPSRVKPVIGVDLGGTKIQAAVVSGEGRAFATHRRETDVEGGPANVVNDVLECIRACLDADPSEIEGVGVGVAGQVDAASGLVRSAPNLEWSDFPLGPRLEEALGVPVHVENDLRAITWGEWKHGAGRGFDDLLVLFVGTGVGGGVVSGGRLLTGDRGTAGELGHVTLVAGGRECSCPNQGCIEAYVGGWAIAERAKESIRAAPAEGRGLLERAGGGELDARVVSEAAADGDPLARRLLDETGRYLGAGAVGLVHAFNPRRLVLGGGVVDGNPELVEAVESAVRTYAIPVAAERLEVRRSELGARAGVVGSASLARRRLGRD